MQPKTYERNALLLQLFIHKVQETGICNYPEIIKLAYRVEQQDRQAKLLQLFVEEVRRTGKIEHPELASHISQNK